jgi:beta-hydroxylase
LAWTSFVIGAAVAPNDENDHTGAINQIFKYFYFIRRVGKRIKVWNKLIYYLIKWPVFGGIAATIFCYL